VLRASQTIILDRAAVDVEDGVQILVGNGMKKIRYDSLPPGVDLRDIAIYTPAEVAYFLDINESTLRSWILGRKYGPYGKFFPPLITPADPQARHLSFYNLAEAHILSVTRTVHEVKIKAIRRAIRELHRMDGSSHPLLSHDFFTEGKGLFLKEIEETINLSEAGQLALKPIMDLYLARIERDDQFNPEKIYPVVGPSADKRIVSIMPFVSSGQPIIDGEGIPVSAVWSRYRAGESVSYIADDYDISIPQVEGALSYVEHVRAA
jgi:uncharacterized protein (DUF433 family)